MERLDHLKDYGEVLPQGDIDALRRALAKKAIEADDDDNPCIVRGEE